MPASTPDRPISTAALLREKRIFRAHCISAVAAAIRNTPNKLEPKPSVQTEEFEQLWNLTQTSLPQLMALTRDKLTPTKSQIQLYKSHLHITHKV